MNENQETKTNVVYWMLLGVVVIGLFGSVYWLVDIFLHPNAVNYFIPIPYLHLLMGFIVGPLTIGMGLLILRRQANNLIGLLLMLIGESWIASSVRVDMNNHWLIVFTYNYSGSIWFALFILFPYFPDGKIYPPKPARIGNIIVLSLIIFGYSTLFADEFVEYGSSSFPNPLFVPILQKPINSIQNFGGFIILGMLGLGLFSLIQRFRKGDTHTRSQIRWLIGNVIFFIVYVVFGFGFNLYRFDTPYTIAFSLIFYVWLMFFPIIGIAYAILRHKLYDIDIIIRRTLIYSILSAILLGVYFGTVIIVQQVFQSATGEVPDFAIVLSTLLIAALFNPLRQYIQAQIDRRFYRRKYDVEQTLAEFQQNLREEVDMPTLQSNLVAVVNETMQPSSIRLWMKE